MIAVSSPSTSTLVASIAGFQATRPSTTQAPLGLPDHAAAAAA